MLPRIVPADPLRSASHHLLWLVLAGAAALLLVWLPLTWAILFVAATAVLLLTLARPLYGLGLTLIIAPFGAFENNLLGNQLFDTGQLLLFLTLAAWLAGNLARRQIFIAPTPLNLPLLLFGAVGFVTLLWAPSVTFAAKEIIKWLEIWLLMQMVIDLARDKAPVRYIGTIVGLLLAAGVLQALIGIWQFGWRGDGPVHFQIAAGLYRAYGTFQQPNPYGGFLHLNSGLALGCFLGLLTRHLPAEQWIDLRRRPIADWRWLRQSWRGSETILLLLAGVILTLLVAGLLASWSRGAWLGFAAGGLLLTLCLPRRGLYGVLLGLGGVLSVYLIWWTGLLPARLTNRLTGWLADFQPGDVRGIDINDANFAVLERLAHWQAAIDMARDNLWLGVGFGNYEPVYSEYALLNWVLPLGHAHNYYLNLLAEVGIVGLMAYAFLWLTVFHLTWRLLTLRDWRLRGVTLGLLAAWGSLSVHHFLDKLYVNNMYLHIGVMFGLLMLLEQARQEEREVNDFAGK